MSERKYTMTEIDRMRTLTAYLVMFGTTKREKFKSGWGPEGYETTVELRLRTYMLAGLGPEDLEKQ